MLSISSHGKDCSTKNSACFRSFTNGSLQSVSPIAFQSNASISSILSKKRVASAGISVAERPTPLDGIGPFYDRAQVRFEMHNRTLTATVRQIHVVALMQQEKHDRARTEIEGNSPTFVPGWQSKSS